MVKKRLLLILLLCLPVWASAQWMPERSDRLLNDYAQQLSASEAAALEQRLVAFNDSTSNQIVVITTPTLGGGDVLALSQQIGQQWGVGQKEYDNGVVILIKSHSADEDWGDVAIATGYGIEGALPDVFCKRIIDEQMLSPLSEGDYYTAITRALDIIMPVMQGEYSLAQYSRDQDRQAMRAFAVFALAVCVMVALLLWHKKKHPDQWRGGGGFFWGGGGLGGLGGGGSLGGFGGFGGGSFGGGGARGRF